jgi:hypothetical protein
VITHTELDVVQAGGVGREWFGKCLGIAGAWQHLECITLAWASTSVRSLSRPSRKDQIAISSV